MAGSWLNAGLARILNCEVFVNCIGERRIGKIEIYWNILLLLSDSELQELYKTLGVILQSSDCVWDNKQVLIFANPNLPELLQGDTAPLYKIIIDYGTACPETGIRPPALFILEKAE